MAIPFLNNIDLSDNQLLNAKLQITGTAPAAEQGQVYFNSAAGFLKPRVYDGAAWLNILDTTSVISGTYVSSTITSNVDLTLDLSAVDGTSTAASRFLTKDNKWATIPFGDITAVLAGTYINVDNSTGPEPTINHDLTTRTDTASAASPGSAGTFTTVDSVTTNTTGHITALNLKTITLPASVDTTYDLTTAPTGTAVRLTDGVTPDDVTISGTTGRTAMSRINASELRVDLTDDVTIINDLTVGNNVTLTGGNLDVTGTGSFTGEVTVPTATVGTSAPNLAQVELLVAGVGVFQGSYNAATNTPALEGASNVALDQGDYFVVSVSGTFLGEALEPGDFIFANNAIAANSTPALSNYTVVQADDNVAGAGATDGATQKGVAGFDSATFDVSANGWVQLKPLSNPYGTSVTLTSGVDAGGETTFTVDVTALFGATASAANCKAEVLRASDLVTVYPEVSRNGTGDILFKFVPVVADSAFKALITIV